MTNDQTKVASGQWSVASGINSPADHGPQTTLYPVGHWGLIIGIFAVMTALSWFGWNDPIIDFGREIYVPWQIMQGKVLYRDIAYFNGPLSAYFNTVVFSVLGVKIGAIVAVNLALLAALTAIIWRLWSVIGDRLSATVSCIVLLTVFSFIQLVGVGNYNFVTPYSHEITHGIILSFASILMLAIYLQNPKPMKLWIAGLLLGSVFLTKAEVFLAAGCGVGAGAVLAVIFSKGSRAQRIRAIGGFLVAAVVPAIIAFLLLWIAMPASAAFRGILGSWVYFTDPQLRRLPLYQRTLGTLDMVESLFRILAATVTYAAIIAGAWLIGTLIRKGPLRGRRTGMLVLVVASIIGVIAFSFISMNVWQQSIRGWTILVPAIAAGALLLTIRHPQPRNILRTSIAIFAAVLLARTFFNVRTFHYGFALAMPATLLVIVAAIDWLPKYLDRRGGYSPAARAIVGVILAMFVAAHLLAFNQFYRTKMTTVRGAVGSFHADTPGAVPRGMAVNALLEYMKRQPLEATLVCIPEGAMINALAGRENPTPYVTFLPPEMIMFGPAKMLAALQAHPPDYILMFPFSSEDYGDKPLETFGPEIVSWIGANYTQAPDAPNLPLLVRKK